MEAQQKIKVAAVVGPTASGKTRLGVQLAKLLGGEVISADSMQIYEGMNIASAKPTAEEMHGVPHHLIGFVSQSKSFSVAGYVSFAKEKIADVSKRSRLPIIVGGTGLYVDSLLNNISFAENDSDPALREELNAQAKTNGALYLWNKLNEIDPESAQRIEPNNIRRVVRALEVFYTTGVTLTEQNRRSRLAPTPYRSVIIGLKTADRSVLYDRINRRVDEMVRMGLLDEAKAQLDRSNVGQTASKAIGIKELAPYFSGEQTLDEALETMKRETRRYAKRQLTWFLRNKDIHWFNTDEYADFDEIAPQAAEIISNALSASQPDYRGG